MAMHNIELRLRHHEGAAPAELEEYTAATGLRPDAQSYGALLHAHARAGDTAGAAGVYERMQAAGAPGAPCQPLPGGLLNQGSRRHTAPLWQSLQRCRCCRAPGIAAGRRGPSAPTAQSRSSVLPRVCTPLVGIPDVCGRGCRQACTAATR